MTSGFVPFFTPLWIESEVGDVSHEPFVPPVVYPLFGLGRWLFGGDTVRGEELHRSPGRLLEGPTVSTVLHRATLFVEKPLWPEEHGGGFVV